MRQRKEFSECIKTNTLIETEVDLSLAKELLSLAEHRLSFWKKIEEESKNYPSLFIEGHYEIIKELATAILAIDGWKARDHECLFAYLREKKTNLELDFDYLLELKDTRNSIGYRGTKVSPELWNNNKTRIQLLIDSMIHYVKEYL